MSNGGVAVGGMRGILGGGLGISVTVCVLIQESKQMSKQFTLKIESK